MKEILLWLVDWFKKNGKAPNLSVEKDLQANFFESGIIDSLEIIGLITDIENNFNIQFSEKHFQDRRFSTISGLTEIINELLQERRKIND